MYVYVSVIKYFHRSIEYIRKTRNFSHVEYLNLIPFSSYRPRKNQLLEDDDNLIVDRRKEPL